MATPSCVRIFTVYLLLHIPLLVNACTREFLEKVEVCLEEMEGGIPRLHNDPLVLVDDFGKMEAYCRLNVSGHVTDCLTELYECPAHVQMRKQCNLASLFPEMLVRRIHLTCAVVDVLKKQMECVNKQTCLVKDCLKNIAREPNPMTFAVLNPPNTGTKCSWLNRVKMCYNLHVRPTCSDDITDYMAAMLDTYKPPSCTNRKLVSLTLYSGCSSHHSSLLHMFIFTAMSLFWVSQVTVTTSTD